MFENGLQYWPTRLPQKRAVTLVIPGLNVRSEAMLPLVALVNSKGSDVYLLCLPGHGRNDDVNTVTAQVWQESVVAAYRVAREAANRLFVPLYFLGYSLGALLGQSVFLPGGAPARFDKQVLLAPATAIRRRCYLLKGLLFLGFPARLPSFTPRAYRVRPFLPLNFYRILFAEEQKLGCAGPLNQPTLVFIDPADELVSHRKLKKQIQRFRLSRYKVVVLNRNVRKATYHHLILDEATLGKEAWENLKKEMVAFLFEEG